MVDNDGTGERSNNREKADDYFKSNIVISLMLAVIIMVIIDITAIMISIRIVIATVRAIKIKITMLISINP